MATQDYGLTRPLDSPANLAIPNLPPTDAVRDWQTKLGEYTEWWKWITGEALGATDPSAAKSPDGSYPLLYPLGINPIWWICDRHASSLFGEVPDDADGMVDFTYKTPDGENSDVADDASDFVSTVWEESHAKEIQRKGAFLSQFLGGCIYRVQWAPEDPLLSYGIRVQHIVPDYVLLIPDANDPWRIYEAWMMYWISPQEARSKYGITVDPTGMATPRVLYTEHWTQKRYEIIVNGQIPFYKGTNDMVMSGDNPFGEIPFVYIPHYVRTNGFYGYSHVPSLVGLTKEVNSRVADVGDFVQDNSDSMYWGRNLTGSFKARKLPNQKDLVDIGMTPPGADPPEIDRINTPSNSGTVHTTLPEMLETYMQMDGSTPDVALGKDKGASQRSALTLAFRMWPLTSHIHSERAFWAEGLKSINRLILKLAMAKGLGEISPEMLKMRCKTEWFPITPRDRKEIVDEAVLRKGSGIISTRRAVEMLAQGEDIEEELRLIDEDAKKASDMQTQAQAAKQNLTQTATPIASTKDAMT